MGSEELETSAPEPDEPLFESDGVSIPEQLTTDLLVVDFELQSYFPTPQFGLRIGLVGGDEGDEEGSDVVLDRLEVRLAHFLVERLTGAAKDRTAAARWAQVAAVFELLQTYAKAKGGSFPRKLLRDACCFLDEVLEVMGRRGDARAVLVDEGMLELRWIGADIVHVHVLARPLLAYLFFRPQEFYEGERAIRRRQPLPRREARREQERALGTFDYYLRWPGFNLPGWTFAKFADEELGPLNAWEAAFAAAVRDFAGDRNLETLYLIGTCPGAPALRHEVCHALYGTDGAYREEAGRIVQSALSCEEHAVLEKALRDSGYCSDEDILTDEKHAYLADSFEDLIDEQSASEGMRRAQRQLFALLCERCPEGFPLGRPPWEDDGDSRSP